MAAKFQQLPTAACEESDSPPDAMNVEPWPCPSNKPRRPPALLALAAALSLGGAALCGAFLLTLRSAPPAGAPRQMLMLSAEGPRHHRCNQSAPNVSAPLGGDAYDLALEWWCPFFKKEQRRPWRCHTYAEGENDAWCQARANAGAVDGKSFYFGTWGGDGRCGYGCSCCVREDPFYCDTPVNGADLIDVSPQERLEAHAWFDAAVNVFVINMPNDRERRQAMVFKLAQQGIAFQVSPGVNMSKPGEYRAAQRRGLVPASFNLSEAQSVFRKVEAGSGGITGTVGCALAHRRVMDVAISKARRTNRPLVLVLEDDAELVADFKVKLYKLLHSEMPCDWEVLSLITLCPHGQCVSKHLLRVAPNLNVPAERCHTGSNFATYAMLYQAERLPRVRSLLRQAQWDAQRPTCLDIDVALAAISDEVAYYAVSRNLRPGFVWTNPGKSDRLVLNA